MRRLSLFFFLASSPLFAKPMKVFLLAGQSNMQGHAKMETFDYLADDPATKPLLAKMRTAEGNPRVCDHAWISYLSQQGEGNGEVHGQLTAGYGARRSVEKDDGKIGPEFTFGLAMDAAFEEPVLIIKAAWGGKSLFHDFRPPSAGVYPRTAQDIEKQRFLEADSGQYYRWMVEHVRKVLADPGRVCPAYNAKAGAELAGFVWLQGWNDMVNRDVYPEPKKDDPQPRYHQYSQWLGDFIRDLRKDLQAPKLPVVIGVMGVDGTNPNPHIAAFRKAMAAPAALPEFRGNVTAVETAPFWSMELGAIAEKQDKVRQMRHFLNSQHKDHANADGKMTEEQKQAHLKDFEAKLISPAELATWKRGASNQGYHYLGCAKTFALMGEAFAEALLKPVAWEKEEVFGWQLNIHPSLLKNEAKATEDAIKLLREMLREIGDTVPAAAVAELRKVPLYFSPNYKPGHGSAEYHPGADWLRENGRDPAMAKGVEFSNIPQFPAERKRMPNFALHELAHAYHDRVLPGGFAHAEIAAAYQAVKASGSYGKVYAMTNPMEYFAETTEAYFSTNDLFPFTNGELRRHDPPMFQLLSKLWGTPIDQ
jgi:hypothetical protein